MLQGAINVFLGRRMVSLQRLEVRPSLPEVCSDPGTELSCAALITGTEAQFLPVAASSTVSFP